jgi:hypothetical protein
MSPKSQKPEALNRELLHKLITEQISKWAKQFSGYNQHDSQELLRSRPFLSMSQDFWFQASGFEAKRLWFQASGSLLVSGFRLLVSGFRLLGLL